LEQERGKGRCPWTPELRTKHLPAQGKVTLMREHSDFLP
jgi:hypothetical protein